MTAELVKFGVVIIVVMLGFAMSFHALFSDVDTFGKTCLTLFKAMLGEDQEHRSCIRTCLLAHAVDVCLCRVPGFARLLSGFTELRALCFLLAPPREAIRGGRSARS